MKTDNNYDAIVIGAGSGGLTSAVGLTKIGKRVLLVEREHMGGECTNTGCIPSKALLHYAHQHWTATKVAGKTTQSETYRQEAFSFVRDMIDEILAEETPEQFEKMGIDVVMGEAVFKSKCSITVGETTYKYKKAIISTGSAPRMIDIPNLNEDLILTNQNLFNLESIPKHTLILGGGPIGMEIGQALAMLGSQVTIVDNGSRFAHLEDEKISPIIEKRFRDLGINILLNATIKNVAGTTAEIEIKENEDENSVRTEHVHFDKLLIGIGRVPNLPKGLEEAGIAFSQYGITVDKNWQTTNRDVYALGDVSARMKFTHVADDTARQVVTRIASRGLFSVKTKSIPKVTYVSPEIAQVGISWEEAQKQYDDDQIMRIEVPQSRNDRAVTDEETDGVLVVIAKRLSGKVLGAHLIGPRAGEIISIFTLAIDEKISLWKLRSLIYSYPTYSLIVKKAGDVFFAQQISSLKRDILCVFKRNITKIIALIFWGIIIYSFQHYRISNDLSYKDVAFSMLHFFTSTAWGPVLYMGLYAIRPVILFPATIMTALSGALFGFWWGVLYTIIGENMSANFAYSIGRFFGKGIKLENSIIGGWVEALRNKPFESVLFMRLFYFPFDLTNYGSGILKIKWSSYFTATLIGILPGMTTFVALGAAIDLEEFQKTGITFDAFDPRFLALSVVIFIASILLSKYLKKHKKAV
jgi:pyruvate/2-oxoglutarate dehydrogenase complex dihydrolipoamide dehydrogenase (E3) component/uncharacterized membrane protein YdjX (TVP38/TMEM64 family)